jgi:hypothetical protein
MDIQERKVDRCGSIGLKHVDIEHHSHLPSIRMVTVTESFVPPTFYYCCVASTVLSIAFTCGVAYTAGGADDCFGNFFISNRLYVLSLPSFHVLYSFALRNMATKHQYYHSVFGFLCSLFYFVTSIYSTIMSWKCSNVMERIDLLAWIIISFLWLMTWLYFALVSFHLKFLKENPLQLLLFIRCVCIPSEVKKGLLIVPYVVAAGTIFINVDELR